MTAPSPRQPGQPLLTIAIPTFNRAACLAELLESLFPQLSALTPGLVELLISDNHSEDDTPQVVADFQQRGLPCRYLRHATNLGADANFVQCFHFAQGRYVWIIGDDDLVVAGALASLTTLLTAQDFDLVYLSSFSFTAANGLGKQVLANTIPTSITHDKLGRFAEAVTDGRYFLERVNALIGLISVVLINKDRLLATGFPPLEELTGTNLMQTGWVFPLLHRRSSVLYVWQRLLAYRSFHSGGWGICEVFGVQLDRIANRYFAAEPELARALMNGVLRYWLCNAILEMRRGQHATMNAEDFAAHIRPLFRRNWRYWLFVYPVAELPLPLAIPAHSLLAFLNRLNRAAQTLIRHWFHHGDYLDPRA